MIYMTMNRQRDHCKSEDRYRRMSWMTQNREGEWKEMTSVLNLKARLV